MRQIDGSLIFLKYYNHINIQSDVVLPSNHPTQFTTNTLASEKHCLLYKQRQTCFLFTLTQNPDLSVLNGLLCYKAKC